MRNRENIPLAIMSIISLAVLFVFGISEMATRATAGSQQAAISPAWSFPSFGLTDLSPVQPIPCQKAPFRARLGS
jgi:hypothetical protein